MQKQMQDSPSKSAEHSITKRRTKKRGPGRPHRPERTGRPKLSVKDRRIRRSRYLLRNLPDPTQVEHMRAVVQTYVPDMDKPTAVEVLLVVLEVCHILELAPNVVEKIFGANVLACLETWGNFIPVKELNDSSHRAWVWMPGATRPLQARMDADGTVRVNR